MVSDRIRKQMYSPYHKEAMHCFISYILVSLALVVIFLAFSASLSFDYVGTVLPIIVLYTVLETVLNFRLSLLALFEEKSLKFKKEALSIERISGDHSFSGHYGSIIPKLYDRKLRVDRYKLICRNEQGKKVALRTVMSGKKYQLLQDRLFNSCDCGCDIIYGKYTKIVLFYGSKELWTDKMNHLF